MRIPTLMMPLQCVRMCVCVNATSIWFALVGKTTSQRATLFNTLVQPLQITGLCAREILSNHSGA